MNYCCTIICLLLLGVLGAAEMSGLHQDIPGDTTPDPQQQALVVAMAAEVPFVHADYDADGQVRALELTVKGGFGKDRAERDAYIASKPGLSDETFARIVELPELQELILFGDWLSEDGFAVLKDLPQLEKLEIEGHLGDNSADFLFHVDDCQQVRWLLLGHMGKLKNTHIGEMEGMASLEFLAVDYEHSTAPVLDFMARCPQLRDLELHRTQLTNEDLARLPEVAPKLERIRIMGRHFDHHALADFARLEHLKILVWGKRDTPLVWEEGAEHLVDHPSLAFLGGVVDDDPGAQRLREARPQLQPIGNKDSVVEIGE